MKIRRRTFGDTPKSEHDVQTKEELLAIDWLKEIWVDHGYTIAYSPRDHDFYTHDTLMVVKNNSYFVIGYIDGNGADLGLVDYLTLVNEEGI